MAAVGIQRRFSGTPYYNEFVVELGDHVQAAIDLGVERKMAIGFDLGRWSSDWHGGLMICVNEMQTKETMDRVVSLLQEVTR